jgi:hypothetical protein
MTCDVCDRNDGFEGDHYEAEYLLTITSPREAAEKNAPEILCANHAQQGAEAYIGFGWAVHVDRIARGDELAVQVSSLGGTGTTNETTGG